MGECWNYRLLVMEFLFSSLHAACAILVSASVSGVACSYQCPPSWLLPSAKTPKITTRDEMHGNGKRSKKSASPVETFTAGFPAILCGAFAGCEESVRWCGVVIVGGPERREIFSEGAGAEPGAWEVFGVGSGGLR
ncbi:hypothetical protein K458DRAFT_136 [Lentithecium fluviatile CBS 122367]|uniref:Secreted protein n=1 Tax=Lentithecium fluviatile CBS 122367 TaxID=1168545 RepID=A0A6G1JLG9_9PLEO|nr:hypothetical protein K458DRAFT_136 [Lentithecium fluviatile CBS 122367]